MVILLACIYHKHHKCCSPGMFRLRALSGSHQSNRVSVTGDRTRLQKRKTATVLVVHLFLYFYPVFSYFLQVSCGLEGTNMDTAVFSCWLLFLLFSPVVPMCLPTDFTLYVERPECDFCVAINTTICKGFCYSRVCSRGERKDGLRLLKLRWQHCYKTRRKMCYRVYTEVNFSLFVYKTLEKTRLNL